VLVQKDADAALIERDIRAAGSPSRAASEQNYLKSSLEFSGTTVPDVRAIVTDWRRSHPDLTRERLTQLAAALWDGPIFECRLAAVILLTDRRQLLDVKDAELVEGFLRTAGTWALVDGLAADVWARWCSGSPNCSMSSTGGPLTTTSGSASPPCSLCSRREYNGHPA
jgi:3-methyladenine DNA glycosylase AlkD